MPTPTGLPKVGEARAAIAKVCAQDEFWDAQDMDNLEIMDDGRWESPQTFWRLGGSWNENGDGSWTVVIDPTEDDDPIVRFEVKLP